MIEAQKKTGIYILSVDSVNGYEVEEYYGLVVGASVIGANLIKDFLAGVTDKIGGRARGYSAAMERALETALAEMVKDAKSVGANAVIGVRMSTSAVNNTMLQASCAGTAVKLRAAAR